MQNLSPFRVIFLSLLILLLFSSFNIANLTLAQSSIEATLISLNSQNFPFIYLDVAVAGIGDVTLTASNFEVYENGTLQQDYFEVTPPDQGGGMKLVDIIFLMDNSGSMGDEHDAVSNNVIDFVNDLSASGFDFALGLCRFGADENGGNPIIEDNGNLTSDINYFQNDLWPRNVTSGSFEPGWDALYESATSFNFRPGALKVFILITDETPTDNGNVGTHSKNEAISILQNNSITTFALVELSDAHADEDYCTIADATNGECYDILTPFDDIFDFISTHIANTYRIRYKSSNPTFDGTQRNVEVVVTYQGDQDTCTGSYIPGAAPKIQRTQDTLDLHDQSWAAGTEFTIKADITDNVAPYVQSATLYYRTTGDPTYSPVPMTAHSDEYWGTIPGSAVETPGLDYYLSATDGQSTVTNPSVDPRNNPHQLAILPNEAPQITHTPVTTSAPATAIEITAEIVDSTNYLSKVELFYRKTGTLLYDKLPMDNIGGDTYSKNIPKDFVTTDGVDYYIYAEDDLGVGNYSGTPDNPHQINVKKKPITFNLSPGWGQKKLFVPIMYRSSQDSNVMKIGAHNRRDMWYLVEVHKKKPNEPWRRIYPWDLPYLSPWDEKTFAPTPRVGEKIKIVIWNDLNDDTLRTLWTFDFAVRALLGVSISSNVTNPEEFLVKLLTFYNKYLNLGGYLGSGQWKKAVLKLGEILATSAKARKALVSLLKSVGIKVTATKIFTNAIFIGFNYAVNAITWWPLINNTTKEPFREEVIFTARYRDSPPTRNIVVTKSLSIIEEPPYYVGQTINAQFTITNKDTKPFTPNILVIGGRGPGGDEDIQDFTFKTDVTLEPGDSYNYSGKLHLLRPGSYHFFVAYQTSNGQWITNVPADPGIKNTFDIIVNSIPEKSRSAELSSPGELRVSDSQGNITGLVNGKIKTEIPHSVYIPDIVAILTPSNSYKYSIAGTNTGLYHLELVSRARQNIVTFGALDIPTSTTTTHQYTVNWDALAEGKDGVTVKTDADSDGTFEETITVGNALNGTETGANVKEEFPNQGVTLIFDRVTASGLTDLNIMPELPFDIPTGVQFLNHFYQFETTATFTGNVTIIINYDDTNLTSAQEHNLKLYKITEEGETINITTNLDTEANTVTGKTDSFSYFGLSYGTTEPFFDNMELGKNGWNSTGAWRLTEDSDCADPQAGYSSPTHAWYYGGNQCKAEGSGYLTSRNIDVSGADQVLLTFDYLLKHKPTGQIINWNPKAEVEVTFDGNGWEKVKEVSVSDSWQTAQVNLTVPDGVSHMQLRFKFTAGDPPGFGGWFIDDVRVERVTIPTQNNPPTADAGSDQNVAVGDTVKLDGGNSSDPDGDNLQYKWEFTSKPSGSTATLSNPKTMKPTFIADKQGEYILQLTVDDGKGYTDTDQVKITAQISKTLFFDDMESGKDGWTANGEWGLEDDNKCAQSQEGYSSPTHAWYYGNAQCRASDLGYLTSPPIDLAGFNQLKVSFDYLFKHKSTGDIVSWDPKGELEVRYDGGSWEKVYQASIGNSWQSATTNLNTPDGVSSIQLRFKFKAGDPPGIGGWFIDDVKVEAFSSQGTSSLLPETEKGESEAIEEFNVEGIKAYPNPVNNPGEVTFEAVGTGIESIQVKIFDILGGLVYEGEEAGSMLEYDCRDNQGRSLPNGIYLYLVLVNGYSDEDVYMSEIRKLVILR